MRISLLLIFAFIFQSVAFACDSVQSKLALSKLVWVAEDYPPYNYINRSGQITGIFTDTLLAIYRELNLPLTADDIDIIPWARLYHLLSYDQGYAAFSMTDTAIRRQKFALVPIPFNSKISIMGKLARKQQLMAQDMKDLKIAVVREDIGHHLLNMLNIPAEQVHTTSAPSMLKMLMHDRVDAIAYAEDVAHFQFEKLDLGKDTLVPLYTLEEHSYNNFIFHRGTDRCIIELFSSTIEQLHRQGELERIINQYLHKHPEMH